MVHVHGLGDRVLPRFSAPEVWSRCGPSQRSYSSSFLPPWFSLFPAPHSACPVPPLLFTRGTEGVPALGPSGGSRLCPQARERLFITRGLLLPFFTGGRGGRRRPSSALQSDVWNGAPGVWARFHRREHPLALFLRSSRHCCGVLSRGPRGALGKRPQFLFFCQGRRHLSHVRINKRHFSLKKTTPSVLSLSVSLPLSFSFFET